LLAVTEFQWNNIMKLVRDGYEKCHFFVHTFVTLVLGRHRRLPVIAAWQNTPRDVNSNEDRRTLNGLDVITLHKN